ncbi:MAG: hypothetical protein ACE5K1_07705 [Acidiferrobacterales bacterium]
MRAVLAKLVNGIFFLSGTSLIAYSAVLVVQSQQPGDITGEIRLFIVGGVVLLCIGLVRIYLSPERPMIQIVRKIIETASYRGPDRRRYQRRKGHDPRVSLRWDKQGDPRRKPGRRKEDRWDEIHSKF